MARINSVMLGKAKNKLGNAVLYIRHGETIAREYVSSILNPNTPAQIDVKNKFVNASEIVKHTVGYLYYQKFNMPRTKTVRSWWQSYLFPFMPSSLSSIWQNDYYLLRGNEILNNNWLSVEDIELFDNTLNVLLNSPSRLYRVGVFVRVLIFDVETSAPVVLDKMITELEWNVGIVSFHDLGALGDMPTAYVFSESEKRASGVMFK